MELPVEASGFTRRWPNFAAADARTLRPSLFCCARVKHDAFDVFQTKNEAAVLVRVFWTTHPLKQPEDSGGSIESSVQQTPLQQGHGATSRIKRCTEAPITWYSSLHLWIGSESVIRRLHLKVFYASASY